MEKHSIKITSDGPTSHVFVDGVDVAGELDGYEIKHYAGDIIRVDLHYKYYVKSFELDAENAIVKDVGK